MQVIVLMLSDDECRFSKDKQLAIFWVTSFGVTKKYYLWPFNDCQPLLPFIFQRLRLTVLDSCTLAILEDRTARYM